MQIIRFTFLIISLLTFACSSKKYPEKKLSTTKLKSTLDSLGKSILDEGEILGFSVSIDSAGKAIYNGAFGHTDANKTTPVTEETRFDIASVSKLIGVCVIMKLVEQEKLQMDQTLHELLPDFPEKDIAQKIRLSHLVSHTSGLQDYAAEIDSVFLETGIVPGKKEFLAFFQGKDLFFEPGTNYQYCNSGFMMMAFIAENITGKTWQQTIDEFVNTPSGLDFQIIGQAFDLPQMSPIFDLKENQFEKVPAWVYVIGDGGLTATPQMLSRFPFYWTNGKIIQHALYEEMILPKSLNDSTTTGYGFGVRSGEFFGEPMIGHTGGWKTTYSIMSYFPAKNITFVGLMNTDGTPANINKIFAQFMSIVFDKSIPDYKTNKSLLSEQEKFIGQYHGFNEEFDKTGSTVSIVSKENGGLNYCLDGYCEPIHYMGNNKFWIEKYPYDFIEFHIDKKGNVTALKEYYYGFFQVFRKRQAG